MNISMKDAVNYEDLNNVILKRRENNMLFSDYQISVLNRFNINYLKYTNYHNLLFDIEEILFDEYDDDLDNVSNQIAEFIYYKETKK